MLKLYHHGSSVCAAKVRLSLEEKALDWDGLYVDILKGEQFTLSYRQLNPKSVVPTLVHDGFVIVESTIICEYLEDAFHGISLRPDDAKEGARLRYWTRLVDEELHPACAELTFAASHRFTLFKLGEEKVRKFLDSTPQNSVTKDWHNRKKQIVRQGFKAPGVIDKVRLYDSCLSEMDRALGETTWLTGETFSLADTALIPYVMRLDMLCMSPLWENGRLPHVERWLGACKQRRSFDKAIWKWLPDSLRDDLKTNGAKSWKEVARILKLK